MTVRFTSLPPLLVAGLLVSAHASAAEGPPRIDTDATCRAAARADAELSRPGNDSCLRSEREAHDLLVSQWNDFRAADRSYCARLATLGGLGSYVQLLTCLEMQRDVRVLREREHRTTAGSAR